MSRPPLLTRRGITSLHTFSGLSQDSVDDISRGMILWISHYSHCAAVAEHFIPFGNSLLGVVSTFRVNCRSQYIEYTRDIRLIKKHNVIHTAERRNKCHTFIFAEDRTAGIFDGPHGFITIDGDNKDVAQRSCALQIPKVSDVENVEAPVGQYHVLALQEIGQLYQRPDFHCASPFRAATNSL